MTKQEKLSKINNNLVVAIAEEKAKKAEMEASYYANLHKLQKGAQEMREAVFNEPDEVEEPQEQPTVWLNGEQWSCAVVARRILNKLPKLNYPKESFNIEISPSHFGGCGLSFRYVNTIDKDGGVAGCELIAAKDTPDVQAMKVDQWLNDVEVQMARACEIMRKEGNNE